MPSGYSQDVVILNDFSGPDAGGSIERRERTSPAGDTSVRYSMSISAEPMLHDFNPLRLGAGPSKAIVAKLRELMSTFVGKATLATQDKRMRARTALAIGHPSTVARYTGGRTGASTPNVDGQGRLYFDSGRFANGLVAMENKDEGGWTINVPANRLDPRTFGGGESAIVAFYQRLVRDIPEFLGGQALLRHKEIRDAIETATSEAIYVVTKAANAKLASGRWQLARAIARDAIRVITMGG